MKYFLGIELGVKNINVGVVDQHGKLLRKESIPTKKERPFSEIMKDIADLSLSVLDDEAVDIKNVKYIGIGSPGIPDNEKGTIIKNYTLNFSNTPIREELQKHINLPVYIDNDANCAALAESVAGAAEDISSSVLVRIGTGIGGGIIIHEKIHSGFNSAGAELGHMVIAYGGEPCTCGRKGCWESYASATALIKQTREAAEKDKDSLIYRIVNGDPDQINELTAFEAAKRGDAVARQVVARYIDYLSEGITNLINILMPEAIIIGGEIKHAGDALLKPLMASVHNKIYCREVKLPDFRIAELGTAAVVVGAAMLGLYSHR